MYYMQENAESMMIVASFPGPRPALRRLQNRTYCKRREAGRGPGNKAMMIVQLAIAAWLVHI